MSSLATDLDQIFLEQSILGQSSAARAGLLIWLASYSLVIYDYICTIEQEVKYIWSCPWTMGLAFFYLNRYLPFLEVILFSQLAFNSSVTLRECRVIIPLHIWLTTIGLTISQTIMILRTYAIWGRRRLIFWILAPMAAASFSFVLALTGWKTFHPVGTFVVPTGSQQVQCQLSAAAYNKQSSIGLLVAYLLALIAEAVITILTAIKAREHVQKASPTWVIRLYRDGFLYCACLLTISAINAILPLVAPSSLKIIFFPLQRTLHSIFCNRVIFLILQHRYGVTENTGTWQSRPRPVTYTDSAMDIFTTIQMEDMYDADVSVTPRE
ncbi:hypothetical protein GALMADRAFT_158479 [Galerina marginata CBS 339.88]|uniref:DUF6533 domain-containing protein n=1 Tax=Galerina marginata (strain CBS 339.88) TaxID=685588 RepID=A0A067SYM3_GALM3|nr:hypothetical protein GALMADRAFT_158479 [Galerina marginata CBS 339.88]